MTDKLPTEKELLVLRLLSANGGMYGLAICKASNRKIGETTVYKMLARLTAKGFVTCRRSAVHWNPSLPRPTYRLTAQGTEVVRALEGLK